MFSIKINPAHYENIQLDLSVYEVQGNDALDLLFLLHSITAFVTS